MYKVKNIAKTILLVTDKGGKQTHLKPGESVDMLVPPAESYLFNVEKLEKTEELKKNKIKKEDIE